MSGPASRLTLTGGGLWRSPDKSPWKYYRAMRQKCPSRHFCHLMVVAVLVGGRKVVFQLARKCPSLPGIRGRDMGWEVAKFFEWFSQHVGMYLSMKFGMYSLIWRKVDLMWSCESKLFQIMRNFLFHWTQIFHVKVNKYEKCYNLIQKMKLYCLIKSRNSGFLKLNRIILIIFTLCINFQLKYFLATKLFYIYK